MLEQEDIVEKRQYCERPPRFKYLLTPKGVELQAVLVKMAEWGEKYQAPLPLCDPSGLVPQPSVTD